MLIRQLCVPKSSFNRMKEESGCTTNEPASMLPLRYSQSRLDVCTGGDVPRVFLDLRVRGSKKTKHG
jgi:hypothetical protein